MKQVPRHVRSFEARYYELDNQGELIPTALISLFEETAVSHLGITGWNVYRLLDAGFCWILLQGSFSMIRYPRYGERFTIETWVPAQRHFYGLRQFEIKDAQGLNIGSAQSIWLFYDIGRQRPATPLTEILEIWQPDPALVLHRETYSIDLPENVSELPDFERFRIQPCEVRSFDIDTNNHVNHVRYIEWVLDSVPTEIRQKYRLRSLKGQYLHEIVLGQQVLPYAKKQEQNSLQIDEVTLLLAVYAGINSAHLAHQDSRLAASAISNWVLKA
ncbi:acyl-[acyl-carrier-protein] thioesterase [Gracilinema caldarium]|uniref:Acyl-ACP thioesterase n=1 Tax=Gracilinema caldarium (strain ATCC 51460 / DSM 7334 / H1) TaxID=744872 RepID=F8F0B0_GRAC1|nr:acyl-ACP thioesterase domain-containing protein [Gracilinema caldarium]AEJ18974.1 acyl-ACP thioesterase [Gracilinema caldarium DSM 7334]